MSGGPHVGGARATRVRVECRRIGSLSGHAWAGGVVWLVAREASVHTAMRASMVKRAVIHLGHRELWPAEAALRNGSRSM